MKTRKQHDADHWLAFVLFIRRDPTGREYCLAARTRRGAVGRAAEQAGLTPDQAAQLDRDGELAMYDDAAGPDAPPYCSIEVFPCPSQEVEDRELADHLADEEPRVVPVLDPAEVRWCDCRPGCGLLWLRRA